MNVFLVAWRPPGALDSGELQSELTGLLRELPEPRPLDLGTWLAPSRRVALAYSAHEPSLLGGVRYVHLEGHRFALFTGRPFRWTGEAQADGRGPLDPGFYLPPTRGWMDDLDGRCAVVRYDDLDGGLEVWTDPLGAYPLFWCEHAGTVWISNSAELLRRILGRPLLDAGAVATVVACGWSLRDSLFEGVSRVSRGAVLTLRADGPVVVTRQLPPERIARMMGAGFDAAKAARLLVAATAALAEWPGRPRVLRLSGGRDSRLLLAAALAAEVDFEVVSDGRPDSADVEIARELCKTVGVEHQVRPADADERWDTWILETAPWLGITAGGAISVEHAPGYFTGPKTVMPLIFNGQGGEIGRAYYGAEAESQEPLRRRLFAAAVRRSRSSQDIAHALLARVATSADLLTPHGWNCVRSEVVAAVEAAIAAGVARRDVRDMFYIEHRMAGWAAIGHGCVEYSAGDNVCPLWSRRLLPEQLGAPVAQRAAEYFPQSVLEELAPRLVHIPFAEWAAAEVPIAAKHAIQQRLRVFVDENPMVPLWEVVDRERVRGLVSADPASLDFGDQIRLYRLVTVFLALRWETLEHPT